MRRWNAQLIDGILCENENSKLKLSGSIFKTHSRAGKLGKTFYVEDFVEKDSIRILYGA